MFFFLPATAFALTNSQINAILSLLSAFGADSMTVQNVENALHGRSISDGSGPGFPTFDACENVNLSYSHYLGTRDAETAGEVSQLQRFLHSTGDFTYPRITGYFGPVTEEAVLKWQIRNGIVTSGSPGSGIVGPRTREAMKKVCASSPHEPQNQSTEENPPIISSPEDTEESLPPTTTSSPTDSRAPETDSSPTEDSNTESSSDSTDPLDLPLVKAKSADSFVDSVGVNVHIGYLGGVYSTEYESIIKPKLLELGIRHVRDKAVVVESDGWMEKVYGRMDELAGLGMKFTLINEPSPDSPSNYETVTHLDRLFQFLSPTGIAAMEGINEHDLSGNTNWRDEIQTFQRALYRYTKENPTISHASVLGPSLGRPGRSSDVGDLSAFMDAGVMHPYPGGEEPLQNLDYHIENLKPLSGARPLLATESGYHTAGEYSGTHPSVSESAMGKYIPRLFLQYFKEGIKRTFSYEFIDQGSDPTDKEENFGLLRTDGYEKPAFTSLKNLLNLLSDPGVSFEPGSLAYSISGDLEKIEEILLQKRDGRFYIILWQEVSSYDLTAREDIAALPRTLTITLGTTADVTIYQPYKSPTHVAQYQNARKWEINVEDHPLVIEVNL